MSIGNRIYLRRKLPSPEVLDGLREIPAANICDCMFRNFAMTSAIRLMSAPQENMCGPALTVHIRAGDNLFFHKALELAQPGDVIVVASGASGVNSLIGEIIVRNAMHKKLGGIVLDTPIRDIDAISKLDIPVYATGSTPGGPFRTGPGGEINTPISCGNMAVRPGDVVIGDRDGVIVLPLEDAENILSAAKAYAEKDAETLRAAAEGSWNREWIDSSLKALGTEVIDACYS